MKSTAFQRPVLGAWILAAVFSVSACTHTTRIVVKPDDSKIYVDNKYVGTGRATTEIENAFTESFDLRIESASAGKLDAAIPRSQLNVPAVLGSMFCGLSVVTVGALIACPNPNIQSPTYLLGMGIIGSSLFSFVGYRWASMSPDTVQVNMYEHELRMTPETKTEASLMWDTKAAPRGSEEKTEGASVEDNGLVKRPAKKTKTKAKTEQDDENNTLSP